MKRLLKPRDALLCIALGYAVPTLPIWDMGAAAAVFMGLMAAGITGFTLIALDERDKKKHHRNGSSSSAGIKKIDNSIVRVWEEKVK